MLNTYSHVLNDGGTCERLCQNSSLKNEIAYVISESSASGVTLARLEARAICANVAGVSEVGAPNCVVLCASAARSRWSLSNSTLGKSSEDDAQGDELRT